MLEFWCMLDLEILSQLFFILDYRHQFESRLEKQYLVSRDSIIFRKIDQTVANIIWIFDNMKIIFEFMVVSFDLIPIEGFTDAFSNGDNSSLYN